MATARTFLTILGFGFALVGLVVAWSFGPLVGMAFLIVGAFLVILPFTRSRNEE